MNPVIVFYERVYNLGNYENERIGVQISVPEDSTVDEAWKVARFMVEEEFQRGKTRRESPSAAPAAQDPPAAEVVLQFGKYKGVALGDLVNQDTGYVEWLRDNATVNNIKKAAYTVLSEYDERQRSTARNIVAAAKPGEEIPF